MKKNVTDLRDWKNSKNREEMIQSMGDDWNIRFPEGDTPQLEEPRYFYLYAAMQDGWATMSAIPKSELLRIAKLEGSKHVAPDTVSFVASAVHGMAKGGKEDHNVIECMHEAAISQFVTTRTCDLALESGCEHLGYILYLPNGLDHLTDTLLRPFAIKIDEDKPLSQRELTIQLMSYIDVDVKAHPEWFKKYDVESLKKNLLEATF